MGTFVAIEATAPSETIAVSAIEAAFAAVVDVERRMHPSRAGSDVARINAAPPGARTAIHASTTAVLRLALLLNKLTEGVFDPCLPAQSGRLADLELDESMADEAASVTSHAPLTLDLGGIAKGYAVDRAVAALRQAGCVAGMVNAGGDLRVFGARPQTVLVRRADRSYEPLVLDNAALAVSDLDERRRPPEHRGYYVRTSPLIRGAGAVSDLDVPSRRHAAVLAGDATSADALTKCMLLCPEESARRALARLGGRRI